MKKPRDKMVVGILLVWMCAVTGAVRAQDPAGSTGSDSLGPPAGSEDVEEALRVLDEAGVPPTREDLARFMEESSGGGRSTGGQGRAFPVHGSVLFRMGHYQAEGLDHYGKAVLDSPWLRFRARVREYRSGVRETTGSLAVGTERMEILVGRLGLNQGYGLLLGAPGRGSSLGADGRLGPAPERMVSWLGSPEPRARSGVGLRARSGNWSIRYLCGEERIFSDEAGPPVHAFLAGGRGEDWRLSLAGFSGGAARGASLCGGRRNSSVDLGLETTFWQPGPGIPVTGAAILHAGWQLPRRAGVEIQAGFANLPGAPGMAVRPAVLPGWSGRGFALRGFTRLDSGLMLRGLIHRGHHLDREGIASRNEKGLVDLQAEKRLMRRVSVGMRFRRIRRRVLQWSERYRWKPMEESSNESRTITSLQFRLEEGKMRISLLLRSYALDKDSGRGRRSLMGFSGRWDWFRGARLRVSWGTAWGDPVDLVSAISPLAGLVVPRHWGHWRSETVLGFEWKRGIVRLQAAGALRYPETESGTSPITTAWAQGGIHW